MSADADIDLAANVDLDSLIVPQPVDLFHQRPQAPPSSRLAGDWAFPFLRSSPTRSTVANGSGVAFPDKEHDSFNLSLFEELRALASAQRRALADINQQMVDMRAQVADISLGQTGIHSMVSTLSECLGVATANHAPKRTSLKKSSGSNLSVGLPHVQQPPMPSAANGKRRVTIDPSDPHSSPRNGQCFAIKRGSLMAAADRRRSSRLGLNSVNFGQAKSASRGSLTSDHSADFCNSVAASTFLEEQLLECTTLPANWPATLQIREGLTIETVPSQTAGAFKSTMPGLRRGPGQGTPGVGGFELDYLMLEPQGPTRMSHQLLAVTALAYDMCFLPIALGWGLAFEGWVAHMALATCIFWTIDIAMNFLTGIYVEGELIMRPYTVARHYARTWLLMDASLALLDWISIVLLNVDSSREGSSRMWHFNKIWRLLRILNVVRLWKFAGVLEEALGVRSSSTGQRLAIKGFSMFSSMVYGNHIACCIWFAIGRQGLSDTGASWIHWRSLRGEEDVELADQTPSFQYLTAFHWTLAQITLGSVEIPPVTSLERSFNIVLLLMGLFVQCNLVATLSAAMVDFHIAKMEKTQKLRALGRFLSENHVDRKVAHLVRQAVTERLKGKDGRLDFKSVQPSLDLLSASLRGTLRFEVLQPHLLEHPLFRLFCGTDSMLMQRIASKGLDFLTLKPKDDLFSGGMEADAGFYLVAGQLSYIQDPEQAPVLERHRASVENGGWLCEAALWTHWITVGAAEAVSHSQLMVLNAEDLADTLRRNGMIYEITKEYSRVFHECVVKSKPPNMEYPSDVHVPFTDFSDLVAKMRNDIQRVIGNCALDQAASSHFGWRGKQPHYDSLREEIDKGKAIVMMNGNGELERLVSVVVLRVHREADGCLLARLGKLEGDDIKPECKWPGGKLERGQTANDFVREIVAKNPLNGLVELDDMMIDQEVEVTFSRAFGIRTKYLRTVFTTEFAGDFMAPICQRSSTEPAPVLVNTSPGKSFRTSGPQTLDLQNVEVYYWAENNVFYAWLTSAEFEIMKSSANEPIWAAWLTTFTIPDSLPRQFSGMGETTTTC